MRKDQKDTAAFSTFMHTLGTIFAFATVGWTKCRRA